MAFGGNVDDLVDDLLAKGRHLRDDCDVGCVTYMTCLRRAKGFLGTQEQFEDLMKKFNDRLVEIVTPEKCMRVHRVKGFSCRPDGSQSEIAEWAADLLHPGPQTDSPAFQKYLRELRAALYHAVPVYEERN